MASTTGQLVGWRDVGDRAMQTQRVVIGHELGDRPPSDRQDQRRRDTDVLSFAGLEPTPDLAVALGIACRCLDVCRSADPEKILEGVPGHELRAVVRNKDPRPEAVVLLRVAWRSKRLRSDRGTSRLLQEQSCAAGRSVLG